MVKVINKYETIFIINNDLGEEAVNEHVEKFKTLISSAGEIENIDLWGKRRLAYEINDLKEGYYVYIRFTAETIFPKELERIFKITEGILRHIVIRIEE